MEEDHGEIKKNLTSYFHFRMSGQTKKIFQVITLTIEKLKN